MKIEVVSSWLRENARSFFLPAEEISGGNLSFNRSIIVGHSDHSGLLLLN